VETQREVRTKEGDKRGGGAPITYSTYVIGAAKYSNGPFRSIIVH